jgi:hypothetical protein
MAQLASPKQMSSARVPGGAESRQAERGKRISLVTLMPSAAVLRLVPIRNHRKR